GGQRGTGSPGCTTWRRPTCGSVRPPSQPQRSSAPGSKATASPIRATTGSTPAPPAKRGSWTRNQAKTSSRPYERLPPARRDGLRVNLPMIRASQSQGGMPMTSERTRSIGERIADARKSRGLTQKVLADRALVSLSLLRKVEQGSRDATPAVVAAVANALTIDVTALTGQPYDQQGRHQDRIHTLVPALRRALTYWDLPPDLDTHPRPWPEL